MKVDKHSFIYSHLKEIHGILFNEPLNTNIDFVYGEKYNLRILDYQKRLYKKAYENLLDNNSRSKIYFRDFLGLCIGCHYKNIPAFYDVENDLAVVKLNNNNIINLAMHEVAHKKILESKLKFKDEEFVRRYLVSDEEEDFCDNYVRIFTELILRKGRNPYNFFHEKFSKLKNKVSDRLFIKELKKKAIVSINYTIDNYLEYSKII